MPVYPGARGGNKASVQLSGSDHSNSLFGAGFSSSYDAEEASDGGLLVVRGLINSYRPTGAMWFVLGGLSPARGHGTLCISFR